MIGTYAAVLAVCGGSPALGQAVLALCGVRQWSWLSPAVGLALLCAICWGTARLPGRAMTSAVVILVLIVAAVAFLAGRVEGAAQALRAGAPVALLALAAASLPFIVEGHFGILGTGFNPDMSQHLLATDRLVHGVPSQLLRDGYPLGAHAIVAALNRGLGIGLVHGFSGLTVAVPVLAALTSLTALADLPPLRRTAGAVVVGLPYLVASYLAQGAFKETIQALFVLAFVLSLREASRNPTWLALPLRFVPAGIVAIGSLYVYSFPGLAWLAATAVVWLVAEPALSRSAVSGASRSAEEGSESQERRLAAGVGPAAGRAGLLGLAVFMVGAAPELGRMIAFSGFETFDPSGAGLGNLFGQISPLEALGIWPSGDFRVAPGDGAVPAPLFYLGAAFATALLLYGLARCGRRRETALVAGLFAALALYAGTRIGGTPYTAAKAIEVGAPLATLIIVLPLLGRPVSMRGGRWARGPRRFRGAALGLSVTVYLLAAGGCSVLALANAPVGPASYSPALTELRPLLATGSTLVLAPGRFLDSEHGSPYIAWELRGGRVCIESQAAAGGALEPGIRFVVTSEPLTRAPFHDVVLRRRRGAYMLWEREGPVGGPSPCPLVEVRQARQGG